MKTYFKVFLIAATTQMMGFGIAYIVEVMRDSGDFLPLFIGLAFIVFSMLLSLFLALKWCKTKRSAFLTFFLLPTNYTILAILALVAHFVGVIINILNDLPSNFG